MSSNQYYYERTDLATTANNNPYIKQNHMRMIYINKNFSQNQAPLKVHVNPNFKRQVHINPNFNGNVHINPSILHKSQTNLVQPKRKVEIASTLESIENELNANTQNVLLLNMNLKKLNTPTCTLPKVILTKNKFIRMSPESAEKKVIRTKYKLIRTNVSNTQHSVRLQNKFKIDNRKDPHLKIKKMAKNKQQINKFKLDRRAGQPNSIIRTRYKLIKAYMMNLNPRQEIIKPKLISKKAPMSRFIKIRGRVFKFSKNYECLYLVSMVSNYWRKLSQIIIKGHTYIQKDTSTYIKVKQLTKPNQVKLNKEVLRKNNMPCLIYRKTGVCKRLIIGRCFKRHNPDEIRICIKFLQGACVKKDCPLSHKISPDKLPTCNFFLEGKCHKDNCQYLHVKLSKDSKICQDFLQGFCLLGRDCDKRHQFICPIFEVDGKCNSKQCPYPHGNVVRLYKDKLVNKIVRSTKQRVTGEKILTKRKIDDEKIDVVRYYDGDVQFCDAISKAKSLINRPKVGTLPAFIPFGEE